MGIDMNKEVILFDIIQTTLDLEPLKPKFKETFGSPDALPLWFSRLLHTSTVCIVTNVNTTFTVLAGAMLESVADYYNCQLTESKRNELLTAFANLPPHADMKSSLQKLRSNGFKTVAFANSSLSFLTTQIKNAELIDLFDDIISVEKTGSFKPDPNVYKYAAKILGEPLENLRLVATHDWDTHGALSTGLKAAYIERGGAPYNPLYLKPDIQSNVMTDIADQIIARY